MSFRRISHWIVPRFLVTSTANEDDRQVFQLRPWRYGAPLKPTTAVTVTRLPFSSNQVALFEVILDDRVALFEVIVPLPRFYLPSTISPSRSPRPTSCCCMYTLIGGIDLDYKWCKSGGRTWLNHFLIDFSSTLVYRRVNRIAVWTRVTR